MKIIKLTGVVGFNHLLSQELLVEKETPITYQCEDGDEIKKSEMYKPTNYKCYIKNSINIFFTDSDDYNKYSNQIVDEIIRIAQSKCEKAKLYLEETLKLKGEI